MESSLLLRSAFLGVLSLLLANAQDNIETVLNETDFQVQQIANQAILNRANTCGSLSDCSLDTCKRRPCWPQSKDEIQKLSCVQVFRNGDCTSPANGTCQSLSVSTQKTYLRVPPDQDPEKDRDFQTVLCAQKSLDKKLQQAWNNTKKFSLGWAFFGGIEGYLYVYPGRDYVDSGQCDLYDPRLRPWFLNTLAVQKSLYILLDTSTSMSNPTGVLSSQTRFNVANNIINQLLNTLTNGDQVAVSTIGGEKIGAPVSVVLDVQETSLYLAGISSLKDSISNTSVTNSASNIKNGLQAALDFFNTSSNLNVITLFTDGQLVIPGNFNFTQLSPVLAQLNARNVVVFVYRIGSFTSNDATFQQMQSSLNMSYEVISDDKNPLLKIHSYFDYIAWLRFVAVNKKPIWASLYADSAGLGNVTTSIFPAFDANQQLIGVASIDVLTDGLVAEFGQPAVETAISERSHFVPSLQKPLPLAQTLSNATISCDFRGSLVPICPRGNLSTPIRDFICCGACAATASAPPPPPPHRSPKKPTGKVIAGIAAGGVVAVCAIFVSAVFLCRKCRKSPTESDNDQPQEPDWLEPTRSPLKQNL
ncbi:uncharacterized protein LOC9663133 [Selaginella moellendorffii]|uniref:uncharacterized protein LOC9663133 n=1 Tax=Selaginella moellendorffii TaxID=88036 RepID=UPI000D1C260D|nr:uncharacterized protein LOC9663133 [Selaginella moellendorffii]|eukprot:XP_024517714.1 uncharacterized protein LOC9663133 [Selaginella moellendorffii]